MGLFEILLGTNSSNKKDKKYLEQEMTNMYEYGYDEPEFSKYDNEALREEKFANYEYFNEENEEE